MKKIIFNLLLVVSVVSLSSCATDQTISASKVKEPVPEQFADVSTSLAPGAALELVNLLIGTYATRPEDRENRFVDRKILLSKTSDIGAWIYYQLNTGEEGKLYRQRIIHLTSISEHSVLQKTYTPKDLASWEDAWDKPALLASFSADDLQPALATGCDQVWTKLSESSWRGYVDPKTCKIFSKRRQKNILIEGESVISQNQLLQAERGFDENGDYLWGSKPDTFITLERLERISE